MQPPELRQAVVIYVTLFMTSAVRVVTLLLIVWLTAAASFPPCCWSMASAHDHQAQQKDAAAHPLSHDHHHEGGADLPGPEELTETMSAVPPHSCDIESAEAVATTRVAMSLRDLRAAEATYARVVTPHVALTWHAHLDSAPPDDSPGSAFLNPLRI